MEPPRDTPHAPQTTTTTDPTRHQWDPIAHRIAPLIDGIEYYPAVHHAISSAQHQILILGWELHSEVRLLRGNQTDNATAPAVLADLLEHTANANPDLTAHLLIWEGASLFALEREHLPRMTRPWEKHPRVKLVWDTDTPDLGSHHQKIVVVDDRIAFAGGMDLTRARWDSHQHLTKDPRRRTPGILPIHGNPYHDAMIALDGQAAQTLGTWARERWQRATGQTLQTPQQPQKHSKTDTNQTPDPWPPSLEPILKDRPVAISLTQPDHAGRPEIRQVENAFIHQINDAKHLIFIETQYLAAEPIANALAARLEATDGPEIILIMPFGCPGKLQSVAMDTRRDHLLTRLRSADHHQRLGAYWPTLAGGDTTEPFKTSVYVHAKVLITDDRLLRIGSANLNNRSMGLDTELDCTVTEQQSHTDTPTAIARTRHRLLAYLLDTEPHKVEAAERQHRSTRAAIEALRGGKRTLHPFEHSAPRVAEQLGFRTELADPPRPVGRLDAERVLTELARHTTPGEKLRKAASDITGFLKKPLNTKDHANSDGKEPEDPNPEKNTPLNTNTMRLRLVSWNIHSCNGTDRKHDPKRIADALRTLDADIIGLQEVDWREGLQQGLEQHHAIAEHLRMHAIAGPNLRDDKGEFGNALLTRLPIERVHRLDLSTENAEPRGAIDALLRHHEGTVRAVVTHLGLNRNERRKQIERLAKHLNQPHPDEQHGPQTRHQPTAPRCLLGDLNEWRPTRRALAPLLPELFNAAVAPRTFPARCPLVPLDRILAGPAPVLTRRITPEDPRFRFASDHRPVVVDAQWQTPNAKIT